MSGQVMDTRTLEKFQADGFLVIREFYLDEDLNELLDNVNRFVRDIAPGMRPEQVFYENKEDPGTLKQIQQLGDHDPWFHELFTASRFRELAEQLLDGPVVPKNLQFFNKPAKSGQPTPPHQDGYYFKLDPCEAVTIWFALDKADEENGCVRYVKGSHDLGMREHARTQTLGFSQGMLEYPAADDSSAEVAMPASPGDLIVHNALTIHRADRNQSADRSRRSLGFVYFSERACEDAQAIADYQRRLTQDMKEQRRI